MKKILFPTDFSTCAENAFRYALHFADEVNASIQLLHVIMPEYENMDLPTLSHQATQDKIEVAKSLLKTFTENALTQVQLTRTLKSIPIVQSDIEIGGSANLISSVAQRDNIDMIVMGTKQEHNFLEKLFDSVASSVIKQAHCPVMIIPGNATYNSLQSVIYASDLSESDPVHIWKMAALINPIKPVVRCVHVHLNGEPAKKIDMDSLQNFFDNQSFTLQLSFHEIQEDNVATGLEEFAEIQRANMVVMYKQHEGFFHRLFRRSATRQMALHGKIPLLVMKDA